VGRPKEHDASTGAALLDAAEQIVNDEGLAALSVRRVADLAGTTIRAVYAVFGSKEGLVVALGRRAFDWLADAIDSLPTTDDPAADLVDAGVQVFRRLVVEHPGLFKIGVQHTDVPGALVMRIRSDAASAFARLQARFERLDDARRLPGRDASEAATQFHALCEGLAALELRCILARDDAERIWRDALSALITGFGSP
jgi:AcrR family transcriptional regulator